MKRMTEAEMQKYEEENAPFDGIADDLCHLAAGKQLPFKFTKREQAMLHAKLTGPVDVEVAKRARELATEFAKRTYPDNAALHDRLTSIDDKWYFQTMMTIIFDRAKS